MEGLQWKTLIRAHDALNEGAPEIALRLFCRLLLQDNVSHTYVFEGYLGRARALILLARYDEATRDLNVCLRRWPDSSSIADVYYLRAEAFRLQHKLCRAFSDYANALQWNPHFVAVHLARGKVLLDSQQLLSALSDFDSVVALDPACAEAFACRARCRTRLPSASMQDAIHDWSKAIELESSNAEFLLERAQTFAKVGDASAAVADYQKAISLVPSLANREVLQSLLRAQPGRQQQQPQFRRKRKAISAAPAPEIGRKRGKRAAVFDDSVVDVQQLGIGGERHNAQNGLRATTTMQIE